MTTIQFELIDHGLCHPDYFQGCGTSGTPFLRCFTGLGDNPREALEDALEQVAMADTGTDVDALERMILNEYYGGDPFPVSPSADNLASDIEDHTFVGPFYYLSILI